MRTIHALAIILTAVALIPGGAHVAELPNKLTLVRDQYFAVQQVYRGWALFGVVIIAALVANLATAILLWRRREPFWLPTIACFTIAASLVVFFFLGLSDQHRHKQLDRDPGQLGESANPLGIRARDQRGPDFYRALLGGIHTRAIAA
jgi:hypothetical protein